MGILTTQQDKKVKNSDQSRQDYKNALDSYKEGELSSSAQNPIYEALIQNSDESERENRKRWERAAAFTGLNTIFQSVGAMTSAAAGVNPPTVDDSGFRYSIAQIEESDKRARENYDKFYKASLSDAMSSTQSQSDKEKTYLKGLDDIRTSDLAQEKFIAQLEEQTVSRAAQNSLDRAKLSQTKSTTSTSTPKTKVVEEKTEMYVLDAAGKRIPLQKEQVTKLHQVGKLYNLDKEYKAAQNDFQRSREYDILIQRAYLLYENEKDNH